MVDLIQLCTRHRKERITYLLMKERAGKGSGYRDVATGFQGMTGIGPIQGGDVCLTAKLDAHPPLSLISC